MMKCTSCSSVIADEKSSCPTCGAVAPSSDPHAATLLESATRQLPSAAPVQSKRKTPAGRSTFSSLESLDGARFVPGTMLAGRYRIVGLLGRGGMGEVYRADDLKLSQPVALKFLPEALATEGAALARFHREVRVARQVSHRNVCRVYDIGETDGLNFLSMEYIRGEELSSLLKRIGRLPPDKALEIARQLCAGIAAAHDNGVLHRDLKPANVMIDGEGNVRVLDFGLAGIAEEFRAEELHAGTPAYMAPEQLAGQEVTKQSDIYALGLVLYEVFTGKRAFEAQTLGELIRLRREATPTQPSHHVKDLDPMVERAILRCLETEPQARPASALQVAAMLPGGDPLAAALAAGETPSPEMVAAAGTESGLRPALAVTYLAVALLCLAGVVLFSKSMLHNQVPLEKSPEVLADRAASLIAKLGDEAPRVDRVYGLQYNEPYLTHVMDNEASPDRWQNLSSGQPAAITFWYRQSPRYLVSRDFMNGGATLEDPPLQNSGEALIRLDTRGQLLTLHVVPPQLDTQTPTPAPEADWSALFTEAGFDVTKFKQTEPRWTPPVYADSRAAWDGVYPNQPQIPIHIEAAAYRGQPVYFSIIEPWTKPLQTQPLHLSARERSFWILMFFLLVSLIVAGALLALRNLRLGRGDRKGAFRLALFIFTIRMIGWMLYSNHVPMLGGEVFTFARAAAWALMSAGLLWMFYIALEPYVRRRWPHVLISWSRLLNGSLRDPMVGRDILIGAILGAGIIVTSELVRLTQSWTGARPLMPSLAQPDSLLGLRGFLALFISDVPFVSLLQITGLLLMLLLLTMLLKKQWLAIMVFWLVFVTALTLAFGESVLDLVHKILAAGAFIFVLTRFGFLAGIFSQMFLLHSEFHPHTMDFSAWYAQSAIFALVMAVALVVYGFYISLGGQSLFREGLLKE